MKKIKRFFKALLIGTLLCVITAVLAITLQYLIETDCVVGLVIYALILIITAGYTIINALE